MPDSYDAFPPCGFDWADGEDIRPGTPTAANALLSQPNFTDVGMLEELPESPEIERGEQATFRHTFKVDWVSGVLINQAIGRGQYIVDSNGFLYKVLTCSLQKQKGDIALLIITSECLSFDNPPDEFSVHANEINPEIEKHPKFFPIMGNGIDTDPYNLDDFGDVVIPGVLTGPQIVQVCKNAAAAISVAGQQDQLATLSVDAILDDEVRDLALLDLFPRYLRGESTFYLAGWKVVWSSYFWLPPLLDGGGYIQDPVEEGGLPSYFWSSTLEPDGENILLDLAQETNPQIYENGISWLRLADEVDFSRTWFRLTRTWIGGPLGQWDKFIYPLAIT